MDLKGFYRKIRETEISLEEFPVVKSLSTENGGVAGRLTETTRGVAARLIVEGAAVAASAEEAEEYRRRRAAAQALAAEKRNTAQVQFQVISEADLRELARGVRSRKG